MARFLLRWTHGSRARSPTAAFGAVFSWSFTTLAVAAKSRMTSIRDYMAIETAFTVVQWIVVATITAALA
jgi:hypothetical protein